MYIYTLLQLMGTVFHLANETLEQGSLCYFWHVPAGHIDTSLALSFSSSLSLPHKLTLSSSVQITNRRKYIIPFNLRAKQRSAKVNTRQW